MKSVTNPLKFVLHTLHITVGCLCFLLVSEAWAQTTLAGCSEIEDADARLACYDEAAASTKNLPVVRLPRSARPAAPSTQAPNQEARQSQASGDDFGLELKKDRNNEREQTRTYRVAAASHNDFTGWTIEFEDGGTWKQVGTEDYDIVVGERYTIRRASFNSFQLSSGKSNKKIRVTRVE